MQKRELEKIKKKLLLYSSVLLIGVGISSCEKEYKNQEKQKVLVKEIENGRKEKLDTTDHGCRNGK